MDTVTHLLPKFQSRLTTKIDTDDIYIVLESVTDIPTAPFMAILDDSKSTAECVWVTLVTVVTKTLTVTRAQRGTTGVEHVVGTLLYHSEIDMSDFASYTTITDANGRIVKLTGTIATPAMPDGQGAFEIQLTLSGAATRHLSVTSTWLNIPAATEASNGHNVFLHSDGIQEDAAAQITGAYIAFQKYQAILGDDDFAYFSIWNLNLTQTLNALFEVNDPAKFGYVAGGGHGAIIGTVPLYSHGYSGRKFIAIYGSPGA